MLNSFKSKLGFFQGKEEISAGGDSLMSIDDDDAMNIDTVKAEKTAHNDENTRKRKQIFPETLTPSSAFSFSLAGNANSNHSRLTPPITSLSKRPRKL